MNKVNKTENISIEDIPSFLNTDLYNIRVCERNWKQNFSKQEVHELFFRRPPFEGSNFVIAVGMPYALRFLEAKISEGEHDWLVEQGYSEDFVKYLKDTGTNFFKDVDIWSVEEGTVVFADEPIMRVEGPSNAVQMLETYLLNQIGYPSLVATKAARCAWAANQFDHEVLLSEYGMRRAHVSASHYGTRAAYIGGFDMTSNSLAGRVFGIPVSGSSMMHADIQRRDDEKEAFKTFYEYVSYKNKVILLIDTYDVRAGTKKAIEVARDMRKNGHELYGVRIDSGDLKELVPEVKNMFAEAGFPNIKVLISGDMDEYRILELANEHVEADMFGVGTKLVTSEENPSLGVVYKLKGIIEDGEMQPKIKVSEDPGKTTLPGAHQVFRQYDKETGFIQEDIIGMSDENIEGEPLLKQVVFEGDIIEEWESSDVSLTKEARDRAVEQVELLPDDVLNFNHKALVDVTVSEKVANVKKNLLEKHSN